jgi:hypothetical protein
MVTKHQNMETKFKTTNGSIVLNTWNPSSKPMPVQNRYIKTIKHKCEPTLFDQIIENSFDINIAKSHVTILMYFNRDIIGKFSTCQTELNDHGHVSIWITSRIKIVFV